MLNEVAIKVVLAVLLGGLIGFERERRHRPAGFRTIMLVCLGATLAAMLALGLNDGNNHLVAAVLTGIGFLGAGAIISSKEGVKGLTTAATIWLIACIGLGIGLGYYWESVIFVVVSYAVLELGGYLEKRIKIKQ